MCLVSDTGRAGGAECEAHYEGIGSDTRCDQAGAQGALKGLP